MRSRLARIGSFLIAIGVLASVPGVGRAAPSGGASPVTVPGGGLWKQVVAGSNQTCGLAADGTVWCWGSDALGQLGDGRATGVRRAPVAVSTGGAVPERFLEIDSSEVPTCALAADGTVWCWGSDTLHHDDDPIVASPTPVDMSHLPEGLTFAHLAVAGDAACAIASDGTVWCWGEPTDGTFEPTTDVARPERVAMPTRAPETFVQIDANAARFCAVASDGSIWCWGYT